MLTQTDYRALLKRYFGYDNFRPGQEAVIEALAAKGAALAVFPTGGGKSLCYQLPALTYDGVTLVVSPLIALMKDQIDALRRCGIAASRLDSSLSQEETKQVTTDLISGTLKLLYVAPERFNNERFLATLKRVKISLFAVDEAHCISEWGHNFRPDYLKMAETARDLGAERVLALTATATPSVVKDICRAFEIPAECAIVTGFYRNNLQIGITPTRADQRDVLLLKRLQSRPPGSGIVYVTLQKTAEKVANLLTEAGVPARAYHAGMESEAREAVQNWWMHSDRGIVVATIAFGMGIDKADVRYVTHYNLPKSLESYSQEIGRAGRDGLTSTVEMFACRSDIAVLENFAYGDTPSRESLLTFLQEILTGPTEFDISLYQLANRHDIRQLVARTALTYVELLGVVRQGTPFYAGYEVKLLRGLPEILAEFKGEPAQFVHQIFQLSKKGRIWYGINPDEMSAAMGQERRRIVRCIEFIQEHGWAEVKAADSRMRYTRLGTPNLEELADELYGRFVRREYQEIRRLEQVLALATGAHCITNELALHFGEERDLPCGHCSFCRSGRNAALTESPATLMPKDFPEVEFRTLRATSGESLATARQAARFLCGLTSPAQVRGKLARHPLFGSLEDVRFATVMEWCGN